MPSLSDIRAGGAYVELGTKDSKLVAGLNKSAKDIEKFGKAVRGIGLHVAGAGATILTPLAAAGTAYAEHGEALSKGSKKTGVGVEALSTLSYAAQQTGTDGEALEKGFTKMSKTLAEAASGSKAAQEALADLGVSVADVQNLSQEDRFKLFADRISKIQDPAQQAAAAMKIFGKGGAELLPLLQQGGQGIDDLQARARALGLQMSTEDAKGAEQFSRSLKDLWDVLQSGTYAVGAAVAPVLQGIAQAITTAVIAVRGWIQEHKTLFAIVAASAAGLVALGVAIVGVGTAISIIGGSLAGIGSALGIVAATVGAIVSPIGLVIAGLTTAGILMYKFSDIGQAVGQLYVGIFKDIWRAISFVFENTSTLSEAWSAAMTEAGFFVLRELANVSNGIVALFISTKGYAVEIWNGIGSAIVDAAYTASDAFLEVWSSAIHAWRSLIASAADFFTNAFIRLSARQTIAAKFKDNQQVDENVIRQMRDLGLGGEGDSAERTKRLAETYGGKQLSHADVEDLIKEYGERQVQSNTASATAEEDAAYQKKLDDLKKETEARKAYLEQMRSAAQAAAQKETAEAAAENEKQYEDAVASYAAARQAYEAEQKKKHEKDGGGSLLDNLSGSFESLINPDLLKKIEDLKTAGAAGDLAGQGKVSTAGTFNASAAFGFGAGNDAVAKNTQKTAENTQSIYDQLRTLNQNSGVLLFS